MLSELAVVFCAILAFEATFCVCFPIGKFLFKSNFAVFKTGLFYLDEHLEKTNYLTETWENEEDDGYQVILKSPSQVMKVEVVDENGNARIQEMELTSEEERFETEERVEAKPKPFKCNWRRLYKLYLSKRKAVKSVAYPRNKKKQIREAFKVVCENPEDAITYLLDLVQV